MGKPVLCPKEMVVREKEWYARWMGMPVLCSTETMACEKNGIVCQMDGKTSPVLYRMDGICEGMVC